jgi:hypothetical protein
LKTTLTPQDFVDKYNKKQGQVKGGALCFFGHWFGRPYDNYHQLEVAAFDYSTNTLTMAFDERETLTIYNPQDISEFESKLTIGLADKIYWKWFSYGKPQIEDNVYFIEITREGSALTGNSNVDWYVPNFKNLDIINPALLWT